MSTSELELYHQRTQFCQPYVEFMTQVVTLLGARKASPNALSAQLRRQIERVKAFSLESRQSLQEV